MPGKKEYYVSFMDNHTWWTHVELLHTKDEVFKPIQTLRRGQRPSLGLGVSKGSELTMEAST